MKDLGPHWVEDCDEWRGRLLTGEFAHWCMDWDGLPIDETCMEWPCGCAYQQDAAPDAVAPPDGD